jgi:hypothetical protein
MPKAREVRHALPQAAFAEDPQGGAVQVAYGMARQAEPLRFLPQPARHVVAVGDQVAAQGEDQGERMLRHRVHRVVADVRYHDAALPARGDIDIVRPGRRDPDEPERRQALDRVGAHRRLVDDRDRGVFEPRHDFPGGNLAVLLPDMRESRAAHLRIKRMPLQEDDALHGSLHLMH